MVAVNLCWFAADRQPLALLISSAAAGPGGGGKKARRRIKSETHYLPECAMQELVLEGAASMTHIDEILACFALAPP